MVATDSYRLSVKETRWRPRSQGSLEANVPARALQELARIAQQARQPSRSPSASVRTRSIFELGEVVLSSRLIDGQFPNYRQLLPESVEHELRLATRRADRRRAPHQPARAEERAAAPAFGEGELTVSAQTPDVGEASETMPVPFHGEPFEIGFNPEFLRDGLESVESEELVLKLISPLRPGLIESPDSGEFVYLIMPIRLNA